MLNKHFHTLVYFTHLSAFCYKQGKCVVIYEGAKFLDNKYAPNYASGMVLHGPPLANTT